MNNPKPRRSVRHLLTEQKVGRTSIKTILNK